MTIGFIGFGEAGFHLAKGLRSAGAGSILAYDIHASTPGRGDRIRGRAGETGTVLVDSPAGLAQCRIVISVVTADSALDAASQNRPHLQGHQIYADFNSVSPDMKKAIAKEIAASPAHFVEGAIMAPVPSNGHRVPILLNGPFASELTKLLTPFGMKLECLSEEIGAAAAVKMCRSIVVKGLEALMLECTLAASRFGARELVFASLAESYPGIQWPKLADYMIGRVFEHGERRAREMEEVAKTLRAIGVDPIMAEATARVQDWRARVGAELPGAKEMLAALGRRQRVTVAASKIKTVIRVASGNLLEMYDFMVFGYYAAAIGRAFFPKTSEFASLMLSLATFGAGFLMRPLGALVLGAYLDSHGRRAGLILTLSLMSLGTLSIAVTPGYQTIGLAAPLIILAGRLVQGFSAGAELGGVSVYLAEIATPAHKGFYVSWQSASQQIAVVLAALSGVALHSFLTPKQVEDWGWRAPLVLGCLIVPILFLIRRGLMETEEFQRRRRHSSREVLRSVAENWRLVLMGTMLVTMTTVAFYTITAYTPTFGRNALHLADKDTLIVTLCVGISNFIALPVMGALSDRVGRRPLLIVFTVLTLLTAYPALLWLAARVSFSRLLTVELWLSIVYGGYNGAMVVYLTEIMPAHLRASGFSLAYSLATALFGGFTPMIATYLIEVTHNVAMPGVWMSVAAGIGLIATLWSLRMEQQYEK